MLITVFAILVSISGIVAIYFRQNKQLVAYALMKPLTTILVIGMTVQLSVEQETEYGISIVFALVFSLIGDVLLLKEKWFVFGLASFLIAHLILIYSYSSLFGFQRNFFLLLLLLSIGGLYYRVLLPHLKSLVVPVALYFLAIIVMDWQALGLSFAHQGGIYVLLGVSSLLFSFSDAVIAYDKFVKKFWAAQILILSTYWIALFIIGASVGYVS